MMTPPTMVIGAATSIVQDHEHEHLHLLHVVGDAGDERRRPEVADLLGREVGHLVEQVGPDVAAEAHGRPGAEVDGADGEDDLDQR